MIFQPDLAEFVLLGRKTVTRRLCSENERSPWYRGACRYQPGRAYAVQPGRSKASIGTVHVASPPERMVLGILSDAEARREGFADRHAFAAAFEAINGHYDETALVWRVPLCDARRVPLEPLPALPSRNGASHG